MQLLGAALRRIIALAPLVLRFIMLALGQILLARAMAPDLFGDFTLALNWAGFAAILAVAGHQFTITKVLPRFQRSEQRLIYGHALGTVLRQVLALSVAVALAAVVLPEGWLPLGRNAVLAAALLAIPTALAMVRVPASMALGHVWSAQLPENILRPLVVPLSMFALVWAGYKLDLAGTVILAFSVYLASVLGGMALNFLLMPKGKMSDAAILTARQEIATSARHNALSSYATSFARVGDVLIVGALLPANQLALYFVLTRLLDIMTAIYAVIEPLHEALWSHCLAKGERLRLASELRSFHAFSLAWTGVGAVLLMLFGREVLGLFGEHYLEGADYLILLPLIAIMKSLLGPGASILILADRERLNLWLSAASTVLYLLAVAMFTALWGVGGAVGAMLIYVVIRGASQAWACRKELQIEASALIALPQRVIAQ